MAVAEVAAEAALAERIKAAALKGEKLRIQGGGSKPAHTARHAEAAQATSISTDGLAGIREYEPEELVIVVGSGTPIAEIEQAMQARGQMLGFEPPHGLNARATIGGVLACAVSGPRRPYAGAVRDFVLGIRVIDGKGDRLHFGGKVMKNVAGFDVARLFAGSAGTLGLITEVALKCLPLPKATATRVYELTAEKAIKTMNRWYVEADPISATAWVEGRLYVRFSGAESAVQAALARRGGETLPEAERWWADWREHRHAFFQASAGLMRMSCRSTAEPLAGAEQAIEWGGALRWVKQTDPDLPARARYWAKRAGGWASQWPGMREHSSSRPDLAAALSPELRALHARIKQAFDPYHVFPSLS